MTSLLSSQKSTFSPSSTQGLLSLILTIGLLHQNIAQHYNDAATGPSTLISRAYDAYGQLTSETTSLNETPLSSCSGKWNELGIRTTQFINGNTANCVAAQNNLAQITQQNTYLFGNTYDWTLAYDAVGNVTGESLETFTHQTLTWDSFNRLVDFNQQSTLGNNFNSQWTSSYDWKTTYDGLGRRIQTTSGGDVIN